VPEILRNEMTDLFQSLSNIPWVLMRLRKSRLNSWWRRLWVPKHPVC